MDLILHIGTEKTGTTTIQEFLYQNKLALNSNGYVTADFLGVKNNIKLPAAFISYEKNNDFTIANSLHSKESRIKFSNKIKSELSSFVNVHSHKYHTMIISSEQFHSFLSNYDEVEKLAIFLKGVFNNIKVIGYFRPQEELATSLYSTAIKCGHSPSMETFLGRCNLRNPYYNYENLAKNWVGAFGKNDLIFRLFNPLNLFEGNLLKDFFKQTMSSTFNTLEFNVERQNVSLNTKGQLIGRAINTAFPRDSGEESFAIRQKLFATITDKYQGKGFSPTKSEAYKIRERFAKSNSVFFSKYVVGFEGFLYKEVVDRVHDANLLESDVDVIAELLSKARCFEKNEKLPKNEEGCEKFNSKLLTRLFKQLIVLVKK